MSGRRLPLLSNAERPVATVSAARQVLPGRPVIVADTGADVAALTWAARFVEELEQIRRVEARARAREPQLRVPVVLSSFTGAAEAAARFERLAGACAVRVLGVHEGAEQLAAAAGDDLWVLVGQPALIAAHGWLSVLLAADAPLVRWPPALRALRGSLSLELSGAGLEIAGALARELAR